MELILIILAAVFIGIILAQHDLFFGEIIKFFMIKTGLYGKETCQHSSAGVIFVGMTLVSIGDFVKDQNHYKGHVKTNGIKWKAVSDCCQIKQGDIVIIESWSMETLKVTLKK